MDTNTYCRACGLPLEGAHRAVGVCVTCVQESEQKVSLVKPAGYGFTRDGRYASGEEEEEMPV